MLFKNPYAEVVKKKEEAFELPDPLLTPEHVAHVLNVSVATARRIIQANKPVQVGAAVRWQRHQLDDFIASGGVRKVRGK